MTEPLMQDAEMLGRFIAYLMAHSSFGGDQLFAQVLSELAAEFLASDAKERQA